MVVRLGRADLTWVRRKRSDLLERGVTLVEDPSIGVGGCVVETAEWVTDATIEKRLEAVREAMAALLAEQPDVLEVFEADQLEEVGP